MRYAFIQQHQDCWPIRWLCKVLDVHPSGFYAWLKQPHSKAYQTSQRQSGFIKQSWLESGGVYGYRKVHSDLRAWGEQVNPNENVTDQLF